MKKLIIDTDTASDDAVAIIMALREPEVCVEAITVVAGNLPLHLGIKNALISVEKAGTYEPKVYAGCAKPVLRELLTSEFTHGEDGMGNMALPEPRLTIEDEHAVDAMLRILEENEENTIEMVTLGPLTNIAVACLKAPETMKKLKRLTVMGGAGLKSGNMTAVAEFNLFVDAEAAQIVIDAGLPIYFVGWDASMGECFINEADLKYLGESDSSIAHFCVRCNESLKEFNMERTGEVGFDLADPAAMAAALYDELTTNYEAYCYVDYKSERSYGQLVIDYMHIEGKKPNATFCSRLNGEGFKEKLFKLII